MTSSTKCIFANYFQILKEFELAYENINSSAFINEWPELSKNLHKILTVNLKQKRFSTDWSDDIESFLVLLKLFPSQQVGRHVIASDTTFKQSIGKFIKYDSVNDQKYCSKYENLMLFFVVVTVKCSTDSLTTWISTHHCMWLFERKH